MFSEIISGNGKLDGRIKILWIEDELLRDTPQQSRLQVQYGQYYIIYQVTQPRDVRDRLIAQRQGVEAARGKSEYKLDRWPPDIYVSDYNLAGAEVVPSDPEGEKAKTAPAAGLTTAALSALNFPDHPASIVSYTAFYDQAEAQLQLIRMLLPLEPGSSIRMTPVTKTATKGAPRNFFLQASKEFREMLLQCPSYVFTSDQIHSLRATLESRIGSDGVVNWSEKDYASFYTPWGWRKVKLAALWLDYDEDAGGEAGKLTRGPVEDWLNHFHLSQSEYSASLSHALKYFHRSHSAASQLRYDVCYGYPEVVEKEGLAKMDPQERQDYEARFNQGRRHRDAMLSEHGLPDLNGDDIPDSLRCRHMLTGTIAPGSFRLSVMMAMLLESFHRWRLSDWDEGVVSAQAFVEGMTSRGADEDQAVVKNLIWKVLGEIIDNDGQLTLIRSLEDRPGMQEQVRGLTALQMNDLFRLIDPMPNVGWSFAITMVGGSRIGNRVIDKLDGLDFDKLLRGDGSDLRPSERKALRRLALELGAALERAGISDIPYTESVWPEWLA